MPRLQVLVAASLSQVFNPFYHLRQAAMGWLPYLLGMAGVYLLLSQMSQPDDPRRRRAAAPSRTADDAVGEHARLARREPRRRGGQHSRRRGREEDVERSAEEGGGGGGGVDDRAMVRVGDGKGAPRELPRDVAPQARVEDGEAHGRRVSYSRRAPPGRCKAGGRDGHPPFLPLPPLLSRVTRGGAKKGWVGCVRHAEGAVPGPRLPLLRDAHDGEPPLRPLPRARPRHAGVRRPRRDRAAAAAQWRAAGRRRRVVRARRVLRPVDAPVGRAHVRGVPRSVVVVRVRPRHSPSRRAPSALADGPRRRARAARSAASARRACSSTRAWCSPASAACACRSASGRRSSRSAATRRRAWRARGGWPSWREPGRVSFGRGRARGRTAA